MSSSVDGFLERHALSVFVVTLAGFLVFSHHPALNGTAAKKKNINNPPPIRSAKASSSPAEKENIKAVSKGVVMPDTKISEIRLHEITSLRDYFPSADTPNESRQILTDNETAIHYNKVISDDEFILYNIQQRKGVESQSEAFLRAGPRKTTHFEPEGVNAAIVTCGGLCPGLNNVIRELVVSLHYLYNAKSVLGVVGGYNGFHDPNLPPIPLTPSFVDSIHHLGGTVLASSRGGFDIDRIIAFLLKHNIHQLYIIGGDGTHRGANFISEETIKRGLNISVVGIPKTIDNDIDLIDRSFGFQTALQITQEAIQSATTEARCNKPNGIGIVKLMGRSTGFIAAYATLASGDVDLCLVPELPICLEGPNSCLEFLMKRVKEQGHAVVVVAEGAGEDILGKSQEVDAGGNRKLPAIGEFLKKKVDEYFKLQGEVATVKYIDPSYMIRSVAANSSDSLLCMLLGQNAVHGAMAGFTAFSTALVNNRMVYIPIPRLVSTSPCFMDPVGRTWERVMATTRQPQVELAPHDPEISVASRTTII